MRVTILHSSIDKNANPDELETMIQVAAVHETLEKLGCDVKRLDFTLDFFTVIKKLRAQKPDIVFNLVELVRGRGDQIYLAPLLLTQLNIPYTGADANSLLLSSDKLVAKQWLRANHLPTPPWLNPDEWLTSPFPSDGAYIIKSVIEDGSLGIEQDSVVSNREALITITADRQRRFGGKWFAERFIQGREFNIGLLAAGVPTDDRRLEVLSIAELRFINLPTGYLPMVDYAAKWHIDSEMYHATQRSFEFPQTEVDMLTALADISLASGNCFAVSGYARVDIRVDEDGHIWILEINANPSIAPDAGFVAAAERSGIGYQQLIKRLLDDAVYSSSIERGKNRGMVLAT